MLAVRLVACNMTLIEKRSTTRRDARDFRVRCRRACDHNYKYALMAMYVVALWLLCGGAERDYLAVECSDDGDVERCWKNV